MWSLVQEVKKKGKTLSISQIRLTKAKTPLAEVNKALGSSRKAVEEVESSLKEAWKGLNKTDVNLREMRLEDLTLSKDYVK